MLFPRWPGRPTARASFLAATIRRRKSGRRAAAPTFIPIWGIARWSIRWPGRPMGSASPPAVSTRPRRSGTPPPAGMPSSIAGTAASSSPSPGRPIASVSPRPATILLCKSGRRDEEATKMADLVGQQLGKYRLTALLGEGGFAQVYLGEHVYLKSLAAIKVLHTLLAQRDRQTFLSEARLIASLDHPNIVRVLDFDVAQDTPFLVMQFAPNGTLRQRHAPGIPLLPDTILPYVRQVAAALQYAHDR